MKTEIRVFSEGGKLTMARIPRSLLSFGLLIAFFITACATTRVTSVWKDMSYQGLPHKILVIGVAKKPANRRIFEDEFVRQLKARGTDAIASYTVLTDEKQSDPLVIAAKMKEQGADAVLITRLVSKKTVHTYVPGSVDYPPPYYGTWQNYYRNGYDTVYNPGYMAEDTYALIETNLYDAGNDNLIWSASSETEIRGSDQNLIKSYIGVMVNTMADKNLLK